MPGNGVQGVISEGRSARFGRSPRFPFQSSPVMDAKLALQRNCSLTPIPSSREKLVQDKACTVQRRFRIMEQLVLGLSQR